VLDEFLRVDSLDWSQAVVLRPDHLGNPGSDDRSPDHLGPVGDLVAGDWKTGHVKLRRVLPVLLGEDNPHQHLLEYAVKGFVHTLFCQSLFFPVERDGATVCLPPEVRHKGIPVGYPFMLNPYLGMVLQMESHPTAEVFQNRLGGSDCTQSR
jgi:hypothetical protein